MREGQDKDEAARHMIQPHEDSAREYRVGPGRGPMTPARAIALQRTVGNAAVSRMVREISGVGPKIPWGVSGTRSNSKRTQDESGIERGDSPPRQQQRVEKDQQATRVTRSGKAGTSVKGKERAEEPEEIGNPTLRFTSRYVGPQEQSLAGSQGIGFEQEATLQRADGMTTPAAQAYDFWQEVTDENHQIAPDAVNYRPKKSKRGWVVDGPFRPPYNTEDGNIVNEAGHITFTDSPGFSGDRRMTNGYWLSSYEVRFRWKVRRKLGGRFTKNEPFWASDEMVHRVESVFDPQNPDASAPITVNPAGNRTWNVELPN
ncbi:hypothetical protein [Kitasatospora kifunensis]|uniref:Uncharacterized protein n=1 Tax=Kitasatospora kifunensis TaxID=58351 RepID=A0A7W7W0C6_KITKI|nr:hypothetical protein [Kitasatospora kifunensis]MBB4928619.1 hypothetical protein [Kitasatospora kifunensis]